MDGNSVASSSNFAVSTSRPSLESAMKAARVVQSSPISFGKQIGDGPLKAFADLCEGCHWHVVPLEAQRANFALPLIELTCGTTPPSAQTLFGVVAAPCNPLPLSRTPQLSASSVSVENGGANNGW